MNQLIKLLCVFSILSLFGCGPDYILDQTKKISSSGWTYADSLNFEVEIQDSLKIYNLYIDVEHSTEFSNQNLYLMIHTRFPSGKRISEKLSLEMANKAGVWFGNCNSEMCTLSVPIQQGAYFNAIGTHHFTIEQYMRVDPLQGIKKISFKIEDTGQERMNE